MESIEVNHTYPTRSLYQYNQLNW